jgi:preprotein translocase subunit SecE
MQRVKTILGNLVREVRNVRNWSGKRQLVTGLVVIVVVSIIAGTIVWEVNKGPGAMSGPKLTVAQVNVSVLESLQAKNYNQAQTTITQDALNPTDKNNLLLLSTVYEAQKNYNQALSTLKEIQTKYGLDYSLAINLGQVEGLLNNKPDAIKDYQQAITLIQNAKTGTVPNPTSNIQSLQTLIKGLQ